MSEHTLAEVNAEPWRTTVTCSCGWSFEHPDAQVAEHRHATHAGIEQARTALREKAETDGA